MIVVAAAVVAALAIGFGAGLAAARVAARRPAPRPNLESARWERTGGNGAFPSLVLLRRHHPTHDFVTGVAFHDIVAPVGAGGAAAARATAAWTVAIVMIDRRTGTMARVLLADDDPDADAKRWILRRAGIRAASIGRDDDEDGIRAALAA